MPSSRRTRGFIIAIALLSIGAVVVAAQITGAIKPFKAEVGAIKYGYVVYRYSTPATAKDLGVPLYPAAKVERSYRYNAIDRDTKKPAGYLAQAFLMTPDAADKVATFYKSKMGASAKAQTDANGRFLFAPLGSDTLTVRISGAAKGQTRIEISRASNTTKPAIKRQFPHRREGIPSPRPRMDGSEGTEV